MEYVDIVNEDGLPTGGTVSREEAHARGIRHRTAHVWLVRRGEKGNEALFQKRSMEKESFPGLYDTSSARRELREELGLSAAPEDLDRAGVIRNRYEKVFHGRLFRDDEVTWVYVYRGPVDEKTLTLQRSEVESVRWFELDGVIDEIRTDRTRFCAPTAGLLLLKGYLEGR